MSPFTDKLKLTHVFTNAVLQTTGKELPDWGFRQQEVVSNRHFTTGDGTEWLVDDHRHPYAPANAAMVRRQPMGFWLRLVELHIAMFRANNQLLVRGRDSGERESG